MKETKHRLEMSGIEIVEGDMDYGLREYPFGFLVKLMMKANQLGLEGKKVKTVEVAENFGTCNKYIDFVCE